MHKYLKRIHTPPSITQEATANIAALRERKRQLRKEISDLVLLGTQVTQTATVAGKNSPKTRTQLRGLNAEERTLLRTMQGEIDDINMTLQALGL